MSSYERHIWNTIRLFGGPDNKLVADYTKTANLVNSFGGRHWTQMNNEYVMLIIELPKKNMDAFLEAEGRPLVTKQQ